MKDIRDYGAMPGVPGFQDGQFASAIDAATAAREALYIPPGIYNLSQPLKISDHTTIVGETGFAKTRLQFSGCNGVVPKDSSQNTTYAVIQDIHLKCVAGTSAIGVWLLRSSRCLLRNLFIENFNIGISIDGTRHPSVNVHGAILNMIEHCTVSQQKTHSSSYAYGILLTGSKPAGVDGRAEANSIYGGYLQGELILNGEPNVGASICFDDGQGNNCYGTHFSGAHHGILFRSNYCGVYGGYTQIMGKSHVNFALGSVGNSAMGIGATFTHGAVPVVNKGKSNVYQVAGRTNIQTS